MCKMVYAAIIKVEDKMYKIFVPDMEIGAQGETLLEAIEMTREVLKAKCAYLLSKNEKLPQNTTLKPLHEKDEFITIIDVNLTDYNAFIDEMFC